MLKFDDAVRGHAHEGRSAEVWPTGADKLIESATEPSILGKVDQARKQAETEAILGALNATLWNRKQAATLLNVDYKALLYKNEEVRDRNQDRSSCGAIAAVAIRFLVKHRRSKQGYTWSSDWPASDFKLLNLRPDFSPGVGLGFFWYYAD